MILSLTFTFLAGFMNAVMDVSAFHYSTSVFKNLNPLFWSETVSAENNQNNFIGFRNDAWHFAKLIMVLFFVLSTVCFSPIIFFASAAANYLVSFSALFCSWSLAFNLFYSKILV